MAYKIQFGRYTTGWIRNIREMPSRVQAYFSHLRIKWLVKTGRVLERVRSHNGVPKMLEKAAVKDLFYGGIMEILSNSRYYHNSSVGSEYNYFTELGKEALDEYLKSMAPMMLKAEELSLNKRAKDLVINGLKGEKI